MRLMREMVMLMSEDGNKKGDGKQDALDPGRRPAAQVGRDMTVSPSRADEPA